MKRFSISRRNSIAKNTMCMPKIVTRSKIKSRGSKGSPSPLLVMIWWGVLYSRVTQIHFCDTGVKMNGEVYQSMLNTVLSHFEETVLTDEAEWYFQQDSITAYKSKKKKKKNTKMVARVCSRFH